MLTQVKYSSEANTNRKITTSPFGMKSKSKTAASFVVVMSPAAGFEVTDCAVARTSASPGPPIVELGMFGGTMSVTNPDDITTPESNPILDPLASKNPICPKSPLKVILEVTSPCPIRLLVTKSKGVGAASIAI